MIRNRKLKGAGGGGPSNQSDTLFSTDAFEFVLGISEGEIGGIAGSTPEERLQNIFIDDVPLLNANEDSNFDNTTLCIRMERGTEVTAVDDPVYGQTPIWYALGGSAYSKAVNQALVYNSAIVQVTPQTVKGFDTIEFRLLIPQLVRYTDDGTRKNELEFEIAYKKTTDSTWTTETKTINGKVSVSPYTYSHKVTLPRTAPTDQYDLKVTKLTEESTDNNVQELVWGSYDLLTASGDAYTPNGTTYSDPDLEYHAGTAQVHVFGILGKQLTDIPTINAIYDGLLCAIPTNYDPVTKTYDESSAWDGQFKAEKHWTDNPFWLAHELITNPRIGMARFNSRASVNRYAIYQMAKYADGYNPVTGLKDLTNPVTGATEQARYTFNAVISEPMDGMELINYVVGAAFARAIDGDSGEILMIMDMPSEPVATVTPEMCITADGDTPFTYSFSAISERYNALTSSYIDADMDYTQQYVGEIRDEDAINRYGLNLKKFEAVGCTSNWETQRRMYLNLSTLLTETGTVQFNMPMSGVYFDVWDTINIVDPLVGNGLSGRMINAAGNVLTVRDPLYFSDAGTYDVTVQGHSQLFKYTASITAGQTDTPVYELTLNANLPSDSMYPKFPVVSVHSQSADNNVGLPKPWRIIAIREADERKGQFAITAQEINPNKWGDADNLTVSEMPGFSFIKRPNPRKPKNLTVLKQEHVSTKQGEQINVWIGWDENGELPPGGYYEIEVREDSQNGRTQYFKTTETVFEISNVREGELTIQVKAVFGVQSSVAASINWNTANVRVSDFIAAGTVPVFSAEMKNDELTINAEVPYVFGNNSQEIVDVLKTGAIQGILYRVFNNIDPDNRQLIFTRTGGSKTVFTARDFQSALSTNDYIPSAFYIEATILDSLGDSYPVAPATPFYFLVSSPVASITGLAYSRVQNTTRVHRFSWDDSNYGYEVTLFDTDGKSVISKLDVYRNEWSAGELPLGTGYSFSIRGFNSTLDYGEPLKLAFNVDAEITPESGSLTNADGTITYTPEAVTNPAHYYEFKYSLIDDIDGATSYTTGSAITISNTINNTTYYIWYRLITSEQQGAWVQEQVVAKGRTLYTWKVYGDSVTGAGISKTDSSKPYVGILSGQMTEDPDISDPGIYAWIKNTANNWVFGEGEPSDAIGFVGDSYLNQLNGDVYRKTSGGWGAPIGNIQGGDGDKWWSGSYNPDDPQNTFDVKEGDLFVNTQTFELFQLQEGSWVSLGIIKGADGQGATVTDNGDGTYTITGANGSIVIRDGNDGDIPTVTDNGDGTYTITNSLGQSVIVKDGENGQSPIKGQDYFDGLNGDYVSSIFRNGSSKPSTPSGGSFNGNSETFPSGWTDTPSTPGEGAKRWISITRYKDNGDGTWSRRSAWSSPTEHFVKGDPGQGATVTDNGDGTYTVTGANGSIVIRDGNDGDIPTVTDNGDGTYTITNSLGQSVIVKDGADGQSPIKGQDYFDGLNGDYVSYVFRNASSKPGTPSGGSFNGTTESFPSGWSDTPSTPGGSNKRWVSTVRYKDDGDGTWSRRSAWSSPTEHFQKGADGQGATVTDNGDGTYTVTGANGSIVIRDGNDGAIPTLTDNGDGTYTITNALGQSVTFSDGNDGTTPIKGQDYFDGRDGDYVSSIFRNGSSKPSTPSGGSFNGSTESFPSGWTDTPSTPGAGAKRWVSIVRYKDDGDGTWSRRSAWSSPTEHFEKGEDGEDGEDGRDGLTPADIQGIAGQVWGFNSGPGDYQGWTSVYASVTSITDGMFVFKASADNPRIVQGGLSINGADSYALRVRIRTQSATHDTTAQLYWQTESRGSYSGGYSISVPVHYKQGDWTYLIFDLRDASQWADWRDNTVTGLRINFATNNASGKQYQIDGIVVGYFGTPMEQDGDELVTSPSNLIANPSGKISDRAGRSAGWKPIEGGYEYGTVKYYAGRKGMRIGSAQGDKSVAVGYKAIAVSPNNVYRLRLYLSCDNDHGNGMYIRIQELRSALPDGKTHIGNLSSAAHIQTRQGYADLYVNRSVTKAKNWYEYDYKPASDVQFVTISIYNWDSIGTDNLWLHDSQFYVKAAGDELKNSNLSQSDVRNGAGWSTLPESGANRTTNTNQLTDGANLGDTALWGSVTGSGKPENYANRTTNTNQLTDGANLGDTAVWGNVTGSGKPANNANYTEFNNYTSQEGSFYYRQNGGGWNPVQPYSSGARTQIDNLRNSRSSDGSRYLLDRDLAWLNTNGANVVDNRANSRINSMRPDSSYKNSNTTKANVGLSNVDNVSQNTILNNAYNQALASELLANPSGEGVNFVHPAYFDPVDGVPLGIANQRGGDKVVNIASYIGTDDHGYPAPPTVENAYRMLPNTGDAYTYLRGIGGTYNTRILPNKKWIFSAYFMRTGTYADGGNQYPHVQVYLNTSDGSHHANSSIGMNAGSRYRVTEWKQWRRISFVIESTSASAQSLCSIRVDCDLVSGSELLFCAPMLEVYRAGNGNTPSALVPPLGKIPIFSSENIPLSVTGGVGATSYTSNGSPIMTSSLYGSSQAKITVNAHTVKVGGRDISYGGKTLSGLTQNKWYYVYIDDPYYQGGSNYVATTSVGNVTATNYRYFLGAIKTYRSGGGGDTQPVVPECIFEDGWLTHELQAKDAKVGDLIDAVTNGVKHQAAIQAIKRVEDIDCIRIVTASGYTKPVSIMTPVDLKDGRSVYAINLLGEQVLIERDGGLVWDDVKELIHIGQKPVMRISVGGTNYLGGDSPDKRVVTHNLQNKP